MQCASLRYGLEPPGVVFYEIFFLSRPLRGFFEESLLLILGRVLARLAAARYLFTVERH